MISGQPDLNTVRVPLVRSRRIVLGGVSAAMSDHLDRPVETVRAAFILLAVLGGGGILLYLWLWMLTPLREQASESDDFRRRTPVAAVLAIASAIASLVAVWSSLGPASDRMLISGVIEALVLGTLCVVWSLSRDPADAARTLLYGIVVRTTVAVGFIVSGIFVLVSEPRTLTSVFAVTEIVLGVVILVIPRLLHIWTELIAERSARERETHRGEVAAHLHDSVLQTLAIIQNRAGPQSEVARLARAQERELRDWLFAGTDPCAGDLATELKALAASLELEHAVRIEVVTVGDETGIANTAIMGAAREAMLNAARHAGGEVAVYLEVSLGVVDLYVRDRGGGFDIESVPDGRLGIRESIVGRMSRAGGTAVVTSGDSGTEVHLRLETGAPR